jgi:pectin methylesterase-like acyl-CoA thioesterase
MVASSERVTARDYFVDPTGANGAFRTVQSAVDAVAGQMQTNRANIFIAPAKYRETVAVDKPFVSFIGRGATPADVTISFNSTLSSTPVFALGETVSIRESATAFMARNLTFENSTADTGLTAALALGAYADRSIFDNVRCLGYQDTLLVDGTARQYFRNSFITGDADFIYGNATAVFDQCRIESTDYGFITAADTARTTANGLIFLDCTLLKGTDRSVGGDGTSAPNNSVFLGRPWFFSPAEQMPSVIFIRTRMGTHIARAGWDPWNSILPSSVNRNPYTRLSEWGSMNSAGGLLPDSNQDGTPDGRVSWADRMSAEQAANYTVENIFGPVEFWDAETQPDTPGIPYVSQGDPWNPFVQLLSLPSEPGGQAQLFNISTRLRVGTGDSAGIAGFIITGATPKKVILRAIGPSLRLSGMAGVLEDPFLELHGPAGEVMATKDNWKDDSVSASELATIGLSPADDAESALVITLPPGQYTAVIGGTGGASGMALVEVYDGDPESDSRLANISTRGFVGTVDDVLIGGLIVGPARGGISTVVVRGIGPTLSNLGVNEALQDPTLDLVDSNGVVLRSNDDWKGLQRTEIEAAGLQAGDDRESAMIETVAAGNYTAIVRGARNTTGVALVEVYNLE